MAGGLKSAPLPLPLSGRLMGPFGTVVQPLVLAVLDTGNPFFTSGFVAFERVGDDRARHITPSLVELAKETLGGALVTPGLNRDVQHRAVLIHRPPEVVTVPLGI